MSFGGLFLLFLRGSFCVFSFPLLSGMGGRAGVYFLEARFILTVRVIVGHAVIFSYFYMKEELLFGGFLFTMALFSLSMLLFVARDSFFLLLLG